MINKNELIFVNKILNADITIRRAAKDLGLRRDDLICKIKEMLKGDTENLKKLDIIILINKILFDDLKISEAARNLKMTEKELDKCIRVILSRNEEKKRIYQRISCAAN